PSPHHCPAVLQCIHPPSFSLFFFIHPSTTEIYTLSLHDALPLCFDDTNPEGRQARMLADQAIQRASGRQDPVAGNDRIMREPGRSEEHTSELQSRGHLICRLLLEKKKKKICYFKVHSRTSTIITY